MRNDATENTVPVAGAAILGGDDVKPFGSWAPGQSPFPSSRELLAIHEAAHAVAGMRHGFRIATVSIERAIADATNVGAGGHAGECDGICLFAEPQASPAADFRDPRRWPTLENEIAMHLAAAVAEARVLGVSVYVAPSWAHERAAARRLAERRGLPHHEIAPFLSWLLERADRLCDDRWTEIRAIQQLLLAEGTIDGARVHAVLANGHIPEASCS